ncbi:TPA: hypothetical protein RY456_001970 [Escherichia albertii]|nr:hypothetical protein [Escherichia albertii]HEB1606781.1 hypothetical protein [Escherichia albertii]
MPMMKFPHGEGGCVCALPTTESTPPPLLPLLNRFDFRSIRPQTLLRSGGSNYGY